MAKKSSALAVAPAPTLTHDPEETTAAALATQGYRPVSRTALMAALTRQNTGVKVKHVGGSFPPVFQKDVPEGSSRAVRFVGIEHVPAERGGGSEFDTIILDVLSEKDCTILFRGQHVVSTAIESYFFPGAKPKEKGKERDMGKPRDPEKTPILALTYDGQLAPKENGRSGLKLWRVEELIGVKVKE